MQLCEKILAVKRHSGDTFAQIRDRFRDDSHPFFISSGEKKWAQEWAVNAAAKLFGAPVYPAAAPTPRISCKRGQGCEALPFRARSITSRAIFSTTCSK